MLELLDEINARPEPFEFYTAADLWTDEHISRQMLACHLDPTLDRASWNHDLIDLSVEWLASRFPLAEGTRIVDFGCGPVLFDVHSLAAFEQRQETGMYAPDLMGGFWSPDRYCGFQNTFKYEDEEMVLDKYTIIEPTRRRTIYNWMQCFSPESIRTELGHAGFEIDQLYADVAGGEYDPAAAEFAVLARRA